jgi:hypothetical protein
LCIGLIGKLTMLAIYCLRLDWFGRVLIVASRVEDWYNGFGGF